MSTKEPRMSGLALEMWAEVWGLAPLRRDDETEEDFRLRVAARISELNADRRGRPEEVPPSREPSPILSGADREQARAQIRREDREKGKS